ncbi:MAG: hypothetical protein ABSE73_13225 [Planctomycetota bacterium]
MRRFLVYWKSKNQSLEEFARHGLTLEDEIRAETAEQAEAQFLDRYDAGTRERLMEGAAACALPA